MNISLLILGIIIGLNVGLRIFYRHDKSKPVKKFKSKKLEHHHLN